MKTINNYTGLLKGYEETPKAVYAAIAVSLATRSGIELSEAERMIKEEWEALYDAGIVPQKPKSK